MHKKVIVNVDFGVYGIRSLMLTGLVTSSGKVVVSSNAITAYADFLGDANIRWRIIGGGRGA